MKIVKLLIIANIIIFPLYLTPIAFSFIEFDPSLSKPSNNGVSDYEIKGSVSYIVEINFTLTQISGESNYYFKFSRLNDRQPNSPLTEYTPPYQESNLLFNNITGYNPDQLNMGYPDRFNNTYDSFKATLSSSESVNYSQKYRVKLNAIEFANVNESDIGNYDTSDEMFYLYCNVSEKYYERDNPDLITLSNSIVNPLDTVIEKAEKICNWVSNNLEYNDTLGIQEKGALWAYNNQKGDCSEYSSLMITLLRIQGIPARKVTGFLITQDPSLEPEVGDEWSFGVSSSKASTILGHAWVEYYVPNVGWIASDPTWNAEIDYFNRIDYYRFNFNIGAWFSDPETEPVSEFSNPYFAYYPGANYNFEYEFKVLVVETAIDSGDSSQDTNEIQLPELIIALIIAAAIIAGLIGIIVLAKKI